MAALSANLLFFSYLSETGDHWTIELEMLCGLSIRGAG